MKFTSLPPTVRYCKYEQRYVTPLCQKFAGLVKHHRSFMLLLCFTHMLMCFYVCSGRGYVHWLGLVFACYRTPLCCSPSPSQGTPCSPSEIVREQEWGLQPSHACWPETFQNCQNSCRFHLYIYIYTVTNRIIENETMVKCPGKYRATPKWGEKKVRIIGAPVFSHCSGKRFVQFSFYNSVGDGKTRASSIF